MSSWYEWVFDGIGTAIIVFIAGLITYKTAIKKTCEQLQINEGNNSKQKQKFEDSSSNENGKNTTIKQTQIITGENAEQTQFGRINDGN